MSLKPRVFGASVRRKEDARFISGLGRYTDDVTLPQQAYAAFVRSPHAHASIRGIDVRAAQAMPDVVRVLTGADYAADSLGTLACGWLVHSVDGTPMRAGVHPPLATDRVRYAGDHVAIVVAETQAAADLAAEQVEVDYEDLPAVVDARMALKPDAPQLHDVAPGNRVFDWEIGNRSATDAAFANAAHIASLDLINNRLVPNAMEPRACNAFFEAGTGRLTCYLSSQNPHGIRMMLSALIGLAPEHKVRVISEDVGGGFGSKAFLYAEEVVCCWAAKRTGRAVKWTARRSESFLADAHGRDHFTRASLALDANGCILALRAHTTANLGAYLSTFGSLIPTYVYATLLSGQYNIPAIHAEVTAVYTNTAPVDAYRGAGRPEASYVVERLVEHAARQLGIDPAEMRRRNFIRRFPHHTPTDMDYDSGDYEAALNRALELIDYQRFPARKAAAASRGMLRGIGFGAYVEAAGIGPSAKLGALGAGSGLWESAEVRVNPTGSVEVLTGCHSHGQSHETTYAQLIADRFGIPIDNVEVVHGDTDKVQFGMGTYGSRSGPVGLSAISIAADKVLAKGCRIAAHVLDVPADSVSFDDGNFVSPKSNRKLAFGEIALAAYNAHAFPTTEIEPGLKEGCFFDPPNFTFPAGCHICEVEIDPDTGVVRVVDFAAVDDFGTLVNPMVVEGQVHGGLAQGIGQAMLERTVYDADSGQLLTGSYMDYTMPRADDLPNFKIDFICTPSPSNPLGIKGCGEAGAIGAPPAFINALTDALGVTNFDMPATPERVWRALRDQATRDQATKH